ncbi:MULTISPECIES: pyridoxamine 5'-phosphate oxidase family protein [unclassified Brevibacterium]|uniref:pyridoxamine 5'-phosphate oxidase family protein n=1 Tax=unclassified Brevibacterium TaxID=2614124 RepID=UPI00109328F0|nr:pyridoxamine 5'-phosphate oxidase family protein [Brevibacterium sp. S22]TGD32643.1 pyridoxamine 5'-phosphate oxidase family protein [Brevibacterium sp. S22]
MTSTPLSNTSRTTISSKGPRELLAQTERQNLYDVLDAGFIGNLGVTLDERPLVVPTAYARNGDKIYMHGSSGASTLRAANSGALVCFTVTHVDGIVYGRAVFNNAMNYRSAVVYGVARALTDSDERLVALRHFSERLAPGSWDTARKPNSKELAQTTLLELSLEEASVKISDRFCRVADQDLDRNQTWSGVLPIPAPQFGEPITDPSLAHPVPSVPEAVYSRNYPEAPPRKYSGTAQAKESSVSQV